jgi:hypothetical protein
MGNGGVETPAGQIGLPASARHIAAACAQISNLRRLLLFIDVHIQR